MFGYRSPAEVKDWIQFQDLEFKNFIGSSYLVGIGFLVSFFIFIVEVEFVEIKDMFMDIIERIKRKKNVRRRNTFFRRYRLSFPSSEDSIQQKPSNSKQNNQFNSICNFRHHKNLYCNHRNSIYYRRYSIYKYL